MVFEIKNRNLTLKKNTPGLEPLRLFYEVLLQSETLLITAATQSQPEDGLVTITGQTNAWNNEPASVTLVYQTDLGHLVRLTLVRSLSEFAGLALEGGVFSDLQLHLHANMPAAGSAGLAQVWREIKGQLHLGEKLTSDFKIQNPAASSALLVEVESELGLNDAAHLFGNADNPEQDLVWLPSELRDSNLLSLRDLQFRITPDEGLTFVGVTLVVDEGHRWPIIPGFSWLAVGGLSMTLDVDYPLQPDYRFPVFSVTGMIQLGEPNTKEGLIAITARWPDFAIRGGLVEGSEIKIGELLRRSGFSTEGLPSGDDTLTISHLSLSAETTSDPKLFNFFIAINNVWSFQLPGKSELAITELSLLLNYSNAPHVGMGGQFTGKLNIAGIDLFIQATHTSATAGWQFKGSSGPGQTIPFHALIADLEQKMGISNIPATLDGLDIENLQVSIDTRAKSFFFTVETKFPVNGEMVDEVITIDLKRGQNNYSSFVSGKIVIDPLEFDLIFSQDKSATMFLAAYQNLAGGELPIVKLIEAVNAGDEAVNAAQDIEIDLKDALFVYDKLNAIPPSADQPTTDSATAKVLFGLDVGGGIDLSNLPLVGKQFPKDQSLRAMFQPIITSAKFNKKDVLAVKQLLPPGGTTLPETSNGFTDRLFISGTLQIGENSFPLGLNISKSPDGSLQGAGSGGSNGTPTTLPPPPAKTDNIKWFDAQKSLGPVSFKRVGFQFDSGILWFLLDASLAAGQLNIALDGLAAGSSLKNFEPHFSLRGLGIDFKQGGVEIGGAFLRRPGQDGQEDEYDGLVIIRTGSFTLSALGSYTRLQGHPSMFIYGVLDYPLGGPTFFFVTGLAAGFGFNRNLKMPAIEGVANFPLVSQAVNTPGKTQDLEAVLASMRSYVPPDVGQIFLVAGIRFSTFEVIDSFALLAIQFGQRFEIDLLGLSTLVVPTPEEGSTVTPLAEVQMALKASFLPDEGFLGIRAQLTPNSFVLSRTCHLTGGFAFYSWFKDGYLGGREGDFVITLGGYHPAYRKPSYYPDVPRVGFNWQVSPELNIKGGLYYALTANALMAGGSLQAVWNSGPLKAWFLIGADFLIAWKPYHYDARVYLDMGVSFTFHLFGTHTISLELGADLHIWGPEFSGVAKLHILIFTVTVKFGGDASPKPQAIDWPTFRTSFLPATDKVCSVIVRSGLVKKSTNDDDDLGIINPKHFTLATNSAIPIRSASWTGAREWQIEDPAAEMPGNRKIHIGSMAITDDGLVSKTTITVTYDGAILDGSDGRENPFKIRPIRKNVPAGLWGTDLMPDLNSAATIGDVVTGFEIMPTKPPMPGHTRDIEQQNLRFETTLSQKHYHWSEKLPLTGQTQPDARQQIENTISADNQMSNRSTLLEKWGFREDRDVRLQPGYAANLMGNPRIIADH